MVTESEAGARGGGGGVDQESSGGEGGDQEPGQGYCCSWAGCRRRYTTLGEH